MYRDSTTIRAILCLLFLSAFLTACVVHQESEAPLDLPSFNDWINDQTPMDALFVTLKAGDSSRQVRAARKLGQKRNSKAIGHLIIAGSNRNHPLEVRRTAIFALKNFREKRVVERLLQCLTDDQELNEIGAACAGALAGARHERAEAVLFELASGKREVSWGVRASAVRAYGALPGPVDTGFLKEMLADRSAPNWSDWVTSIVHALGSRKTVDDAIVLARLYQSMTIRRVRVAILDALQIAGRPEVIPLLEASRSIDRGFHADQPSQSENRALSILIASLKTTDGAGPLFGFLDGTDADLAAATLKELERREDLLVLVGTKATLLSFVKSSVDRVSQRIGPTDARNGVVSTDLGNISDALDLIGTDFPQEEISLLEKILALKFTSGPDLAWYDLNALAFGATRNSALEILFGFDRAAALRALRGKQGLASSSAGHRFPALSFAARLGIADTPKLVAPLLKDSDAFLRETASSIIGLIQPNGVGTLLGPLLSDPETGVRVGAVRGLGYSKDKSFVPQLMAMASNDPEANVRTEAMLALRLISY